MVSPWDIEYYLFPQIVSSLLTILCCFKIVNKLLTIGNVWIHFVKVTHVISDLWERTSARLERYPSDYG
jgi:hypothetical protein